MTNIIQRFFSQTAHPRGFLGRVMLRFMNFGHAPLTNWGLSHIDFKDQWTMLDIGCGGGATLKRLLKHSKGGVAYGIDISEESVAKARRVNAVQIDKQVFVVQGSVEKLPYADGFFDLVTAVETVYFWPDLPLCFQEVKRVMKSGAQFAMMLEVIDTDSKWTSVVDGMTVYSPEQLKSMLDGVGFTCTKVLRTKPSYALIICTRP